VCVCVCVCVCLCVCVCILTDSNCGSAHLYQAPPPHTVHVVYIYHTSILSPTPHSLDIVVSIILDRGARGIVRPMCLLHEREVNHNRTARFVRGGI